MPAPTERSRRFFGAVRSCQEGGKCSPRTRKAAKSMTRSQVRDMTRKKSRRGRR